MTVPAALLTVLALVASARAQVSARWERRADMGIPRQEIGVAAIGEIVYAVAGFTADRPTGVVEAYDTVTDRWRTVAPLPAALHHVAAAAVGGKLYVLGGLATGAFAAVETTFEYDPATDTWRTRAALPAARGAAGVAVIDGRIYLAGGLRAGISIDDFAAYDPAADAWSLLPAMPTARDHLAAAAIAGRFYAVGGRAGGVLFDALEVFDPGTGTWRRDLAPLPTARGGLAAAALGGLLFAFGGEGNAADPRGIFPQAEAYDPEDDAWTRLPDMGIPRHGTAAAAVGDGIYVPGGATRQGFGVSGATEVLLPAAADVLSITRLVSRRGRRLLLDAQVLGASDDPTTLQLRVLDGDREVVALTASAASLAPNRRHTRWRLRRRPLTSGPRVTRLVLRRRPGGVLALRARAVSPSLPRTGTRLTIVLSLGEHSFRGSAALGGR